MLEERHAAVLRPVYGGRRWIIAIDDLSATTPLVAALNQLGAEDILVVAGRRGSGAAPPKDLAARCVLERPLDGAVSRRRGPWRWDSTLVDLPAEARSEIERFDPRGQAAVITAMSTSLRRVAGRPVFGARDPSWLGLDDRSVVDRVWARAEVREAPRIVVPAEPSALRTAAAELDAGDGTVWVPEGRDGWGAGNGLLRWVRTRDDATAAAAYFEGRAHRVRVMPFLDGIPCSIDGLVAPDGVVITRPCELLVLRRPDSRLCYASAATMWDPEQAAREELRHVARRVGHVLGDRVAYRGAFTIDGVMTANGFVPTGLNARYGPMLGALARRARIPLYLLTLALMAEEEPAIDAVEVERELLEVADRRRIARAAMEVAHPRLDMAHAAISWTGEAFVVVPEKDADALLTVRPGSRGSIVQLVLDTDQHAPGPPMAPKVAAAFALADDLWRLGIGQLRPAPDLRPYGGRVGRSHADYGRAHVRHNRRVHRS